MDQDIGHEISRFMQRLRAGSTWGLSLCGVAWVVIGTVIVGGAVSPPPVMDPTLTIFFVAIISVGTVCCGGGKLLARIVGMMRLEQQAARIQPGIIHHNGLRPVREQEVSGAPARW